MRVVAVGIRQREERFVRYFLRKNLIVLALKEQKLNIRVNVSLLW